MEMLCFVVKAKVLCFAIQMSTQLKISGLIVFTTLFQNSTTQIFKCRVYGGLFPEPGRE